MRMQYKSKQSHNIGLVDLISVSKLLALTFVFSLPVFVSAGTTNSRVPAMDPDVDIWKVSVLNPLDGWCSHSSLRMQTIRLITYQRQRHRYISLYGLCCAHHAYARYSIQTIAQLFFGDWPYVLRKGLCLQPKMAGGSIHVHDMYIYSMCVWQCMVPILLTRCEDLVIERHVILGCGDDQNGGVRCRV